MKKLIESSISLILTTIIYGALIMYAYNTLLSPLFELKEITLIQAIAIKTLYSILTISYTEKDYTKHGEYELPSDKKISFLLIKLLFIPTTYFIIIEILQLFLN